MKLKLDEVAVESFATTDGDAETRGTVQGQEFSYPHFSCPHHKVIESSLFTFMKKISYKGKVKT